MNKLVDMTGQRFGRLTVIGIGGRTKEPSGRSRPLWKCICDCGNEVLVLRDNLIHGRTQSCGCFHLEQKYKAHKKYNIYEFDGDICKGKLSNSDEYFIIDTSKYDLIKNFCWLKSKNGYVISRDGNTKKLTYLHRLILNNAPNNMDIDHINRNKLDNRLENLRICTHAENMQNCEKNSFELTEAGVRFIERNTLHPWIATICYKGNNMYLGSYETKEEAVLARKRAEKEIKGEFLPR